MTIDKVLEYIKLKGFSNSYFEQEAGLSNAYLQNIKKSNSEIKGKMLDKIKAAFPDLENYLESENEKGDDLADKKNHLTTPDETLSKLLETFQEVVREKDSQINRLLTVIENLSHK